MKTKYIVAVLIMCLSVAFLGAIALAQPPSYELEKEHGSWCDEMWFTTVTGCEARMVELLNHDVDAVGEPGLASYPTLITMDGIPSYANVQTLKDAGYMMTLAGPYSCDSYFYAINNRVAPLDDPVFRTALAYCLDKDNMANYPMALPLYNFVPPGQPYWYNLGVHAAFPKFNLQTAIGILVAGGYTPVDAGNNPVADPQPGNIDHWHMPGTTTDIRDLEQAVPSGNCIAMQMSAWIESDLHSIGLPIYHTPLPFGYIVYQQWLTPPYLNWDLTVGIGFSLDTWRLFLYEMFNGASIPNWNVWGIDDPAVNLWTDGLKTTLSWTDTKICAFEAEEALLDAMPAIPLLVSWKWTACTGPHGGDPGVLGWVNMLAQGGYNIWNALFSRRELDGVPYPYNIWLSGHDTEVLNPLVSNTAYDWQLQSLVYSTLLQKHPYNGEMLPWCVTDYPVLQLWNGTHTAAQDDPGFTSPTYDPSPIGSPGEVTGEKMTWTLRSDMTWHDGTPVTTADVEFCLDLLVNQNNERYDAIHKWIHDVNVLNTYEFEVYYTGRYLWAEDDISAVALLAPKHVWEPYIDGPDNVLWNGDDEDHRFWDGSNWIDEYGYAAPEIETPSGTEQLTHLIGNGPFIYPYGGWTPGVSMRLVRDGGSTWHFTRILRGDNNFDGITDVLDLYAPVLAYGSQPGMPRWRFEADMANPAGLIDGRDILAVYNDWGYYWYPSSTLPP